VDNFIHKDFKDRKDIRYIRRTIETKMSDQDYEVLVDNIKHQGMIPMSTPFDEPSLEILKKLDADIIKIASFDLGNLPLINRISKLAKPVVISVGGGKIDQIKSSVNLLLENGVDLSILHCVSEYPCEYNKLGLENIQILINEFPNCIIGSSDHFNGTLSGPIAYLLGARVFEKHVTLNRAWKGTDHSFALEPEGFRKFVRDIKRVKYMLPQKPNSEIGEEKVFKKLGKSLVVLYDLSKGTKLTIDNLSGKIFSSQFIPVRESNQVIGRILNRDIKAGEPINFNDFES
jgi:N-acetylneuraminate synthase/sialic acid synthase